MRSWLLILPSLYYMETFAQLNFRETSKSELERDRIFILSDKMASFPGGPNAWHKYLERNLDYNTPLKHNAPPGKYIVIIMFLIDNKGNVSEIKSLTQHGYGMENEAVRLISNGPRWNPAIQKGKAVKSYRKQPLSFIVRSN